jgi:hypothetical protein
VSPVPDPQVDINLLEQTRKQINRLVEEIAKLSETDLAPSEYYGEFLQRVLTAVAAPAGAIWIKTPQGHLQLQYQVNLRQVGIDKTDTDRQTHDELLRMATQTARPQLVPPHSGIGPGEEGRAAPGNPTDYVILIAPILVDKVIAGLVEVWQDADRNPNAQQGFLQFITRMAELASSYTRNHQLRQMVGQQTLWTQLEAFARQIHSSLNPMEVGYVVANEGRRLVECDRVSVGLRRGKRPQVEAISGADVVEKRSNLVRLMAALFDKVLVWGEKLIYQGVKDDSLPPDVLKALDGYLAESNSKLLVVLPLKDEREKESKRPPRSGLMMECFDPAVSPETLIARLEVVGRHATSALYNAAEYRRIPMRWIWQPLGKLQDGLGGKARAITFGIIAAILVLTAVLVLVPYPLKMDAKGQLLPVERQFIFSPHEAQVKEFRVKPGDRVNAGDPLLRLHDLELETKMLQLDRDIKALDSEISAYDRMLANDAVESQKTRSSDLVRISSERRTKVVQKEVKEAQLKRMKDLFHAQGSELGSLWLKSPIDGTILNSGFLEEFGDRVVKPNEPILHIGNKDLDWQVELKIPQKHIGQILRAYHSEDPKEELDVDLVLKSAPTRTFKAKLARGRIGGEAKPIQDDNNETEPVVLAYVRIAGPGIDPAQAIPPSENYLVTGTEVVAKVRCGNHAMGYSLFYGVWEFLYEKVVFFF